MSATDRQPPNTVASAPSDPAPLSKLGEQVFEALSQAAIIFDRRMQIVHRNTAATMLLADAPNIAEALNARTIDSQYEDWAGALRKVLDTRRSRRFDGVSFRDTGEQDRLLHVVCTPLLPEADGQVAAGLLLAEDVTTQLSMERRLAVSERLAAVGKLAARVAHELNNPLDGVLRFINMAMRLARDGQQPRIEQYLQQSRDGLMRMVQIVSELLEFSRSTHAVFEDATINKVVEDALAVMADKATRAGVTVVCDFHQPMPVLRGSSLFQVFCNLIKNAIDAMPDGGTLTVATRIVDRQARVAMQDTGVGLPEDVDRVFEPFYTTKGPGKGTGLGLAICRDIVEKYNGQITAENAARGGAVFTIAIPLESCSPLAPSADREGSPA